MFFKEEFKSWKHRDRERAYNSDMLIADIISKYPDAVYLLMNCMGCVSAPLLRWNLTEACMVTAWTARKSRDISTSSSAWSKPDQEASKSHFIQREKVCRVVYFFTLFFI